MVAGCIVDTADGRSQYRCPRRGIDSHFSYRWKIDDCVALRDRAIHPLPTSPLSRERSVNGPSVPLAEGGPGWGCVREERERTLRHSRLWMSLADKQEELSHVQNPDAPHSMRNAG